MKHHKHSEGEKYEGAPKVIEVLGKGNAYGWIGSIAGLFLGGGIAAFSTKENSRMAQKGGDFIRWISNGKWHISGRWPVIVGGALIGSQIAHMAGVIIGLRRGAQTSGRGQDQFERIKAERDRALADLETIKGEITASPEAEPSVTAGEGSHVAAYAASKDVAQAAEATR